MATKTQIVELQRLMTAIGQLHAWQGDLMAQARKILAEAGRHVKAAPPPRGSARRRAGAGKGNKGE